MASTLILGVGNPLMGDDAVGVLAVAHLREHPELPPGIDVVDGGTDALGLIPVIENYQRVIVADAVELNEPPGTIRRFTWDEVRLQHNTRALSLHQSGLADALLLAEALDSLPPQLVFYGVQPHNKEWDQPLSPAVERALPVLVDALINEVRSEKLMSEKILIIDDDPDVVLSMRMPLEKAGYKVDEANTQQSGLVKVNEFKPDLIVLDVMMDTHTAGFQLALKLHGPTAPEAHRAIPILMVTAVHQTTPLRFGPDEDYLPVDAFIEKPIDPKMLLQQIETLLKK